MMPAANFDYELLDDVLPILLEGDSPLRASLIGCRVESIGPLVEYAFQATAAGLRLPPLAEVVPSAEADMLAVVLAMPWARQTSKTASLTSRSFEFSRVPDKSGVTDPYWTAYVQRVKHAATEAGFRPNTARQLAASFFELTDNIWAHSDAPATGVVGYQRTAGRFEFVIADAGVGVVASLTRKPEFAGVTDAGTALQTALTLAETPYGRRSGRGDGYRNMFANLTNLSGTIRVRSEDHGLAMDGTSPAMRSATTFQTAIYRGFFLSVACRI